MAFFVKMTGSRGSVTGRSKGAGFGSSWNER